jgi:hypothetical protein
MTTKRIALLFAGQGAQQVGMGKDLVEKYPAARQIFERGDSILGRPLSRITFEGPDEELTQTKNCQPALFLHGLACLAALRTELGEFPFTPQQGFRSANSPRTQPPALSISRRGSASSPNAGSSCRKPANPRAAEWPR